MKGRDVMSKLTPKEIADYRYQLIAPVVSKNFLAHGERARIIRSIVAGTYESVDYHLGCVSERTLERFIKLYSEGGHKALEPAKRGRQNCIPAEYMEKAAKLRIENPKRSIDLIIFMLEQSGEVPQGVLKSSTIYDYFVKKGITNKAYAKKAGRFTRYGASYRAEILQGDFHHTLRLPDPAGSGKTKLVKLHAWIDDYSRLVDGQFYWNERLPSLEESLKKWIIRYGLPERIYCDNGSAYSSNHLKQICGYLGIRLSHSRPYKPMGRGKIEKLFQLVESSFKSEVELLIKEGKITDIDQLNNLFSVWLSNFYNQRTHSATKQKPMTRWNNSTHPVRNVPLANIYEAFLLEEKRSVSKTGIISIYGNEYEVEPFLCGKDIIVRYDPYDLTYGIRVFFEDKQFKDAIPSKVHRHARKGYEQNESNVKTSSGINFLEILNGEKIKTKQTMSFINLNEKDGVQ